MGHRGRPVTDETVRPLEGIRVINFGWIWLGAVIGQILGDLGAQVIRIESNTRYDISRSAPPFIADALGITYSSCNTGRSQHSVTLNLREQEACGLVKDLVRVSDMVIDNYRPGLMGALGLGYEDLRKVKPDIIAMSISAAGQSGPLSRISTYGSNVSSLGGWDSVQGYDEGGPIPAGISIVDPLYANGAAVAALAAIAHRRRTGHGQFVDVSQWQLTVTMMSGPLLDHSMNGRVQGPLGNRDLLMAPHDVFPCRGEDAWVSIAVQTDGQWLALCRVMGRPEMAEEPRFADLFRRQRNWEALRAIITAWSRERDKWEIARALQAEKVPAFPVLSDKDAFEERHYWERGTWLLVDHPIAGRKALYGHPWKMSRTPPAIQRPCPVLGADNHEVLEELLCLPGPQVQALAERKVVY